MPEAGVGVAAPGLAAKLRDYAQLMRLDRPVGVWLLLWPTLWGLWFAAQGLPPLKVASLFEPRHLRLAERARELADALVADGELRPELARMQADFAPVEAEGDAA